MHVPQIRMITVATEDGVAAPHKLLAVACLKETRGATKVHVPLSS